MAGYIRQSVADIINGAEITAPPLNAEFNQLVSAFNASSGHSHTGATGEAPKINLTTSVSGVLPAANGGTGGANKMDATSAPVSANDNTQGYAPGSFWENVTDGRVYICVGNATNAAVWRELVTVFTNNKIEPVSHNSIDLGTPSVRFQDLFLSGGISAAGNVAVGGTLNITALSTLNSLTVTNASTMNSIAASGNVTVGGTLTPTQIDVNAGTIDGAVIGGASAQAITGTLITANTNFDGDLTGNVTGNVVGNVTGNVTGDITGDVTGNVTAASGTSSFNNLTVNGTLNMNAGTSATIENLSAPVNANDAARKIDVDNAVAGLVDSAPDSLNTLNELAAALADDDDAFNTLNTAIGTKLPKAGGTMTGAIAMSTNKITGVGDPTAAQDVSTKAYTDSQRDTRLPLAGGTMTGGINMGANKVTATYTPSANSDLTTKTYVDGILGSGTSAATAAANAATSETNAATSASAASSSATAAATSETNAGTSETNALASKTAANTSATSAASSASAAGTSATNAATSETNAATSSTNATNSATVASTSATNAATSATNAASSATAANTSATNAATSETNAASSATAAAASYDNFDDRYLGAKSSAPSVDNDGNALLTGALYWNSTSNGMYAWTGSAWVLVTNYNDAAVNTHINTSTAASGEFLSWNGSDYDWATPVDTNTTYTEGDGGLTQKNFTTTLKNKLDGIDTSANNYTHPNHSGEVTSTADGATVIADNVVDEANLKVSNAPTNGYVLTAQSGNTGGLTWAEAESGADLYADNYDSTSTAPSATGTNAVAIGVDASATGLQSVAVGTGAAALNTRASAFGYATCHGSNSVALAFGATVSSGATDSNALGSRSQVGANTLRGTAIGKSYVSGADSFAAAITNNSSSYGATGANSIAMGNLAKATTEKSVGIMAQATGNYAVAIGDGTVASGSASVALGRTNNASATYTVAIGSNCSIQGFKSIGIGRENTINSSHESSLVLGEGIQSTASNQVSIGGSTQDVRISETYTLPKVDGTASGQVLTTNGSGVVSWAAAGGGADLYAANESSPSAQPSATGTNAIAIGDGAISSNTNSVALAKSRASGSNGFAASINNNTTTYGATGNGSIAMGQFAKGGSSGTAIGSAFAYADGSQSVAIGRNVYANHQSSVALGYGAISDVQGKFAYAGYKNASNGDSQFGLCTLRISTTDATATVMKTTAVTSGVTAINQMTLPNNSAHTFSGTIVAREKASEGTDVGAWEVKGIIRREATAGTTVLVNSVINELNVPTGWAVALTADTTLGCLKLEVTGVASTNIRWVATINTAEVTYA